MDVVERLTVDKPVYQFRKSTCCMCHTVKTLIRNFGANLTVYELDEIPNEQHLEMALVALGGRLTVPAVFIRQELVGGAEGVMTLHVKGKLFPLLMKARAMWI